jgi:allantoin racemase
MKITIINPNTTGEMTEDICESAHYFSRPDTEINCVNPENGPVTIEGFYDEHIATLGLIEELLKAEKEAPADAYIVACFGDPGLYALHGTGKFRGREIFDCDHHA